MKNVLIVKLVESWKWSLRTRRHGRVWKLQIWVSRLLVTEQRAQGHEQDDMLKNNLRPTNGSQLTISLAGSKSWHMQRSTASYMDHTSLVKNYICRRVKVATGSTIILDLPSLAGSLQTNTLPHRKLIQLSTSSQYPNHYKREFIGVAHTPKIWAYTSPSRNGIKPDPAICELLKWAVSTYQKGQTTFPQTQKS
jgi:hypothetical protein